MEVDRNRLSAILYPLGSFATFVIATIMAAHGAIAGSGFEGWSIHPVSALMFSPVFMFIAMFSAGACAWIMGKVSCKRAIGLTVVVFLSLILSWGISFKLFAYMDGR